MRLRRCLTTPSCLLDPARFRTDLENSVASSPSLGPLFRPAEGERARYHSDDDSDDDGGEQQNEQKELQRGSDVGTGAALATSDSTKLMAATSDAVLERLDRSASSGSAGALVDPAAEDKARKAKARTAAGFFATLFGGGDTDDSGPGDDDVDADDSLFGAAARGTTSLFGDGAASESSAANSGQLSKSLFGDDDEDISAGDDFFDMLTRRTVSAAADNGDEAATKSAPALAKPSDAGAPLRSSDGDAVPPASSPIPAAAANLVQSKAVPLASSPLATAAASRSSADQQTLLAEPGSKDGGGGGDDDDDEFMQRMQTEAARVDAERVAERERREKEASERANAALAALRDESASEAADEAAPKASTEAQPKPATAAAVDEMTDLFGPLDKSAVAAAKERSNSPARKPAAEEAGRENASHAPKSGASKRQIKSLFEEDTGAAVDIESDNLDELFGPLSGKKKSASLFDDDDDDDGDIESAVEQNKESSSKHERSTFGGGGLFDSYVKVEADDGTFLLFVILVFSFVFYALNEYTLLCLKWKQKLKLRQKR